MTIKSYFSNRVELAVERAQSELGEDAILISTRLTEGEAREMGKYEVVFGVERSLAETALAGEFGEDAEDEFLQRELAAVSDRSSFRSRPAASSGAVLLPRQKPADPIGPPGPIVMVGPSGAGKTASLMKLAFILAAVRGTRVRVVQLDRERIAPLEPWGTFGEILQIPVLQQGPLHASDLMPASSEEYVLIDSPGCAPSDKGTASCLEELLGNIPQRRTHLVLPAWLSLQEVPAICRRFSAFSPGFLLITRADEVGSEKTVSALASASGLPVSFVSASRQPAAGFSNEPSLARTPAMETAA
jgi:flagellar biosynthesis GTPase FlhF